VPTTTDELDRSFHALAHPVRRALVGALAMGPASVTQAARGTRASKPAITKHLRVLEDAGIVERSVRGRTHVLTLRTEPLTEVASWVEAHRALWQRKMNIVAAYLEETQ
jgi:DNA-binding transcriptional ArsR family regulator